MWRHPKLAERYETLEVLGEGKSTRVLRGRSRNIPRDFAIKVFSFDSTSQGEVRRERARREAEALSKLQHPHLVTLFEVIELDERHLALVMDYIDGVRLDRYVARTGPLTVKRALQIARQIAIGLYEAHKRQLIHRDVKPENVIVRGLASGDLFAHVFDFGIVRGPAPSSITQGFIGSPEFASPEQSTGGEVDARTDIFGLGATLYFLLTGEPPFPEADMWEAMLEREQAEPPRASAKVDIPESVDELLAAMMATNPADRPENMKLVVAQMLEAHEVAEKASLRESTNAEAPPVLLMPAEASEVTEASIGWDAERVTEVTVGPHVVGTRGAAIGFFDQELDIHVVDPSRGLRRHVATNLDAPPRGIQLWNEGVMVLGHDGRVLGYDWDGGQRLIRKPDRDVTSIGGFPDGRAIIGVRSGECLVEQPNGNWRGHRAGRSEIEFIAATNDGVALSTPDGAMLVSALSFDVPLMHLGGPVDSMGFSGDSYLLGLARDGHYALQNVANRKLLSEGSLPHNTLAVAFHDNDLCAYLVDAGRLLRFRLS